MISSHHLITPLKQMMMKPNIPNLRSRRGEAYMLLTVIFLGFSVIVMSLAIDGLGMAVTYRRAVGLATVGAQAGAGALTQFDGSTPELASNACAVAIDTVIASLPNGSASDKAQVSCVRQGNAVQVIVVLKPLRFFGGPLALAVKDIRASAKAEPRYGINQEE